MIGAPTSGPASVPAPPKITIVRKKIEALEFERFGADEALEESEQVPAGARRAPALIVKATVFTPRVLRPTACAAIGFSRTATKARPHGERIRLRRNSVVTAAAADDQQELASRATAACPRTSGVGY